MKNEFKVNTLLDPPEPVGYKAPKTFYCKTKEEFDEAAGSDFIYHANLTTSNGNQFLVGLSHGQSPSGPYEYILEHYEELNHPDLIYYTFVNSKLKRQRGLVGVRDAISFVKELLATGRINKDQILGRSLDREHMEAYKEGLNKSLSLYLKKLNKNGLDYVFLASNPKGQVAGITRNSLAFDSEEIVVIVKINNDSELTFTPSFITKSERIAFLATKSDKRRPLAWLFYKWGRPKKSPDFLRYIENVETRMTVFVDDKALTWPQVELTRNTCYGETTIKIDTALPFNTENKVKNPVILMVHGFLGLNTFDGLLAFLPSSKYVAAAMHYGSVPPAMPAEEYSQFIVDNIDFSVNYFGEKGHPVYLFDHSMANTYFLMIDRNFEKLEGIKKYLRGRISCNPFFGEEAKHASLGFMDNVILKSNISYLDKMVFQAARALIPFETKSGVRRIGIRLSDWLTKIDTVFHNRLWKAIKERILLLVTELGTIPHINKIPMEHTLNRLPVKIFAIQIYSGLLESKKFDFQTSLSSFNKFEIPILILKSERDPVAKFVPRIFGDNSVVTIIEISNPEEKDVFKEHLYYMIHPRATIDIIDRFIQENEEKNNFHKIAVSEAPGL